MWNLLDKPGEAPGTFSLSPDQSVAPFDEVLKQAKKVGLPWLENELVLKPSPQLAALVRRSQELAASRVEGGEGDS